AAAGHFDWGIFLLTALGLTLAHAASNLMNDFWDSRHGLDTADSFRVTYGPHPLENGMMNARQLLTGTFVILVVAGAIGAYLTLVGGWFVAALAVAGGAVLVLYAGDPFPLKYIGLGEIAVVIVWGPMMIGGTYYLLAGDLPWWVIVASLPYALGVTTVLFGKHIDKIDFDTRHRIRTLPIILGERVARAAVIVMIALMYLSTIALILAGQFSLWLLLVLLALPLARTTIEIYRAPKPAMPPANYPGWPLWFVGFAFVHNRRFGSWFVLGLMLQIIFRQVLHVGW
ncbi:MAG: prenyltransferase, partial [Chloroflexota bacterium]|nr:prenyltransferase [Chloroflexota bacterium]